MPQPEDVSTTMENVEKLSYGVQWYSVLVSQPHSPFLLAGIQVHQHLTNKFKGGHVSLGTRPSPSHKGEDPREPRTQSVLIPLSSLQRGVPLRAKTPIIPALTPNRCRHFQLYCTCEPSNSEWETSVGDKCGRQVWETSVNSCGPRHPEWETSVGDKSGRQVWETSETSVGDKCKLMRSQTSRVGDTCGNQVADKCKIMRPKTPRVGDKCGRQGGDKCKLLRPKAPRVGDKCGRQGRHKCKLMRPKQPRVGDKCGRQGRHKCKLMRPKQPRVGDKCGRQLWETSVEEKCGRQVWETSGRQV